MGVAGCYNIGDLRRAAKRRLPAPIFNYIDGGADDERTLVRNTGAFDDYHLVPRVLVDTATLDLKTKVLGAEIDWPLFLSPTAFNKLFHHHAESAVARAAAKFGTLYSLSTLGTTSIEDVAAATGGPKMFQVYIFKDRGLTREFVARCKAAKFTAMALTVDVLVAGNRERDHYTGMSMPPRPTLKSWLGFAMHPEWSLNTLLHPGFAVANVTRPGSSGLSGSISVIDYINQQFDRSITWKDAEWLAKEWGGPFAIKGVHAPEDARLALQSGATAVMVSNHGGRQLDSVPGALDMIPPIVDAVGGRLEIILDGGIRRGTHILKALALGATSCSTGRGYLYGLAAGGQAGVERALTLLKAEVERDMILLGCRRIADITLGHIRHN